MGSRSSSRLGRPPNFNLRCRQVGEPEKHDGKAARRFGEEMSSGSIPWCGKTAPKNSKNTHASTNCEWKPGAYRWRKEAARKGQQCRVPMWSMCVSFAINAAIPWRNGAPRSPAEIFMHSPPPYQGCMRTRFGLGKCWSLVLPELFPSI